MIKVEQPTELRAVFTSYIATARKCAPAGYLTSADVKGLVKRGAALGLSPVEIDQIIAMTAEDWRRIKPMPDTLSSRSIYR